MDELAGKVAFITGVARGQGRSHAVHLARAGADIIGLDICAQIPTVGYPLATTADLAETVRLVAAEGHDMVAGVGDVRDLDSVQAVVRSGVERFGRLDIVVANAGIIPVPPAPGDTPQAFTDAVDVMLTGIFHTGRACLPILLEQGDGGSIVIISSTAGLRASTRGPLPDGLLGYFAAKHGAVGIMRAWANAYGEHGIRVNSLHPTGVATPMIHNDHFARFHDEFPHATAGMTNLLPVPYVEPSDVSNAIVWLCSDAGRYVHGVTLPIDAGHTAK